MIYNTSNSLCIFGDNVDSKINYDNDFTSENYQSLFNKIISVVKVVYKKNFLEKIYISTCNVTGLLAACAVIKAREELGLNKHQLKIIVYTPQKQARTIFNKTQEFQMWNYIAKNSDVVLFTPNKDKNIKNNELEIYSNMVEKSTIILALLPMKDKSFYINPTFGFTAKNNYTCTMFAVNKAITQKKDIRMITLDDVTYKNLISSQAIIYK